MQAPIKIGPLLSNEDWSTLSKIIDAEDSDLLEGIFAQFRDGGAKGFLFETAYIDRDFSAAYSAFYATLFHPYLKYCRRLHFFAEDLSPLGGIASAEEISRAIGDKQTTYLGFVVLRPVTHAPVGIAVLASDRLNDHSIQIDVNAEHPVHLVGTTLKVLGFPITQQDTRVGACAQAAIWMAGRHFHRDHGGPWFSMPDINDVALKPTDNYIARSLPAGSEFLTPDNMVRALRAMDRHPIFNLGNAAGPQNGELRPLHEVIGRYLDSGIPVIIALKGRNGATVDHVVVATGRVMREARDSHLPDNPTAAELTSHILVHDDQLGIYRRLPVREADRSDDYPWTIEQDAIFAVTPLPAKVFMTGEAAETLSREILAGCIARVDQYRHRAIEIGGVGQDAVLAAANTLDPSFYAVPASRLVARTYLTHGYRYKGRALRNQLPEAFKQELLMKQFPRYVWVTEFSLPDDLRGFDMCQRKVRAHVVLDATGSRFGDSTRVVQVPGLSMFWTFDASNPINSTGLIWRATDEAEPYYPKVRGWDDYSACTIK